MPILYNFDYPGKNLIAVNLFRVGWGTRPLTTDWPPTPTLIPTFPEDRAGSNIAMYLYHCITYYYSSSSYYSYLSYSKWDGPTIYSPPPIGTPPPPPQTHYHQMPQYLMTTNTPRTRTRMTSTTTEMILITCRQILRSLCQWHPSSTSLPLPKPDAYASADESLSIWIIFKTSAFPSSNTLAPPHPPLPPPTVPYIYWSISNTHAHTLFEKLTHKQYIPLSLPLLFSLLSLLLLNSMDVNRRHNNKRILLA